MKRLRKHIITSVTIITAAFLLAAALTVGAQSTNVSGITAAFLLAAALTVGAQSTNVSGNWKLTFETPNGHFNPSVVLKQDGEKLTGTYKGRYGESPIKGAIKGKGIKFTTKVSSQGQELQLEYSGTVEGRTMKGKVKLGNQGEADFSGKKE